MNKNNNAMATVNTFNLACYYLWQWNTKAELLSKNYFWRSGEHPTASNHYWHL